MPANAHDQRKGTESHSQKDSDNKRVLGIYKASGKLTEQLLILEIRDLEVLYLTLRDSVVLSDGDERNEHIRGRIVKRIFVINAVL